MNTKYVCSICDDRGWLPIRVRGEEGEDVGAQAACGCQAGAQWVEAILACPECGQRREVNEHGSYCVNLACSEGSTI